MCGTLQDLYFQKQIIRGKSFGLVINNLKFYLHM